MLQARGHDLYVVVSAKPWRCRRCTVKLTDTEVVHRTMGDCRGKMYQGLARGAAAVS